MKRVIDRPHPLASRFLSALEVWLRTLAIALAVSLVLLSLIYLAFRRDGAGRRAAVRPAAAEAPAQSGQDVFTGLGRIRATSRGNPAATVVLTLAFPWDSADAAFTEELAGKTRILRSEVEAWLAAHAAPELRAMDEDMLKRELLAVLNARLSLGKLRELYVSDFLILD